jgi:hypothetical protein
MTGEPDGQKNCCLHFGVLNFLHNFYVRTGEECWHELETNYYRYIEKNSLENYNWEGQFEDAALTANYSNLTHINADQMISYISLNMSDDKEMLAEAETLMRFVEDQFVVWGDHAPWNPHLGGGKYSYGDYWYSPAGLEQYGWYVPIDGSTITIIRAMIDLYSANNNPLLLEKACALADSITRVQDPETGVIPTHWMARDCMKKLKNFWLNCHIATAFGMMKIAKILGEI